LGIRKEKVKMNDKSPVFIFGCHKSGTSLLRALLDGHPDLFIVPFETHYFKTVGHWSRYPMRESAHMNLSTLSQMRAILQLVEAVNDTKEPNMGDSAINGRIDMDAFKDNFSSGELEQYLQAVHIGLYGTPCERRFVEKTVGNEEFAIELSYEYPDATFLHIYRDPYSNLVSLRKYAMRQNKTYPRLSPLVKTIEHSEYFLRKNLALIEGYMPVSYECLLKNTADVMEDVADILNIDFLDCLLEPSVFGEPWSGNSSRGIEFLGVNAENANRWRDEIRPIEIEAVNRSTLQIQRPLVGKIPILPMFDESLKTYMINRMELRL